MKARSFGLAKSDPCVDACALCKNDVTFLASWAGTTNDAIGATAALAVGFIIPGLLTAAPAPGANSETCDVGTALVEIRKVLNTESAAVVFEETVVGMAANENFAGSAVAVGAKLKVGFVVAAVMLKSVAGD